MRRDNNFDALRLVAAVSVIFSHAFLIAQGTEAHEPLIRLTGRQSILGLAGVFVFFAISGFLVTQSYEETGSPLRYLAKRALRIFPGLFAMLVVVSFGLGAIVTTLPLGQYLGDPGPYRYVVANTLLSQSVYRLPGVSFVDNPVGVVANGALWTLRFEFMMYLMVLVLGVLRLLDLRALLPLLLLGLLCLEVDAFHSKALAFLGGWGWMLAFFVVGMILYKRRDTGIFDGRIALLALIGLVLSVPLRQFIPLFPLFGCYLALWLALHPRLPVLRAARFGDLSYGLYIYGWPVEAMVEHASGGRAPWWQVFGMALPLTAAAAFLSWHLVEAPMLRLKPRRVGPAPAPPQARALSAPAAPAPVLRPPAPLRRPGWRRQRPRPAPAPAVPSSSPPE